VAARLHACVCIAQVLKKRRKKRFRLAKWWEERNAAASPLHRSAPSTRKMVTGHFMPWSARQQQQHGTSGGPVGTLSGVWPPPHPDSQHAAHQKLSPRQRRQSQRLKAISSGASFENAVEITTSDLLCVLRAPWRGVRAWRC
jgi:hypothetical protein